MTSIKSIIDEVIAAEGGYVNDPKDSGGETNWGITIAVARANGYTGAMRDMPRAVAEQIYRKRYVEDPGFGALIGLTPSVVVELVDTGVNMGPKVAGEFLQRALNALNNGEATYPDMKVDGQIGPVTTAALRRYIQVRGTPGVTVLVRAMNCLQGYHYIALAEARPKDERFVYGWILNRVVV